FALEGAPNLDLIQPGMVLLLVYEETGEARYRVAAEDLLARLRAHPRNAAGGFWHKAIYPNEMWVDGLYMAGPFCTRYARLFGPNDLCPDEAVHQAVLLAEHVQDAQTGLLHHAWDADRNAPWADPATGLSPEVWGRGMGWFMMALVEMLEDLPPSHEGYDRLVAILRAAARGLEATQDPRTGLWHQVIDKGDRPDNWLETSASAMFIYTLKRGAERGWLEARYERVARRGWQGLQTKLRLEADGTPQVVDAVEGMGVQRDYAAYVSRARLTNSTHGLAAVMLAASAMERPKGK
ncbi:MAG: glycoside hydrolase family 88 protein, partial [Chloroflexi bacterium]|nr:glycoside hydrolase family 88 protein [Chloroflexota bacterium]